MGRVHVTGHCYHPSPGRSTKLPDCAGRPCYRATCVCTYATCCPTTAVKPLCTCITSCRRLITQNGLAQCVVWLCSRRRAVRAIGTVRVRRLYLVHAPCTVAC